MRNGSSNTGRVNDILGRLHQEKVGHVLAKMVENGEIVSVEETRKHSEKDMEGVDFVIEANGRVVCLQVKSSRYYAALFQRAHSDISVVISNYHIDEGAIRRQILKIISAP
ncbi:MAG: hypothetical protein KGJ01_00560 [Patescibacteria group bacterium]|nr:hypothetical protein [Patescibacteria group bacterium]